MANAPVAHSRVLSRASLLTASGNTQNRPGDADAPPTPPGLADLPQGSRGSRGSRTRLLLRRLSPGLPAAEPPLPRPRPRGAGSGPTGQTHSGERPSRGLTVRRAPAGPPRCSPARTGPRRPAPRAWPARAPGSPLGYPLQNPPARANPGPHSPAPADWQPDRTASSPAGPGILAPRRPKPGDHGQR